MAKFQFVSDRAAQGINFGPGGCVNRADQSKFVSIWGKVDGTGQAVFTADQIQNGDIRSADGRASIGGDPVLWKGKPHTVSANGNTYQEFQVPKEDMERWNKYEALQSSQMTANFMRKEQAKAITHGRDPFLEIDHHEVDMVPPQFEPAPQQPAPKVTTGWTPERKAAASEAAKARHAAKQAQPAAA